MTRSADAGVNCASNSCAHGTALAGAPTIETRQESATRLISIAMNALAHTQKTARNTVISKFVEAFFERKAEIRAGFAAKQPDAYIDIVKAVVEILPAMGDWGDGPNPNMITVINHGSYQGTLLFIIGADTWADDFWYVKVAYGSCSGCDTLESIRGYSDEPPTEQQLDDYMTLALHIVQRMKYMGDDE